MEKDYLKAGKIAAEALKYGASLIKPGASWIEIADKIEKKIVDLGGGIAFPAQMSLNDVAAHFIPGLGEDIILKDEIICLDVGAHVNGAIADNACTIDLSGKHAELVKASREALDEAIKLVKPGVEVRKIGEKIHEIITSYGFSPVRNLCGHGVGPYQIHTIPSLPNFDNGNTTKLEKDQVIAIEPFASTGAGLIYESGEPTVFELANKKPVRSMITRQVLKEIEGFKGLPFTLRWLTKKFGEPKVKFALREMRQMKMLREHPSLVDKNHGLVSQAEHTMIVKDKTVITTKL